MPTVSRKITFVKSTIVLIAAVFAVLCFHKFFVKPDKVSASAFGPSTSHTGAPGEQNCTACHTGAAVNSGTGSVAIGSLPASYAPNRSILITVTASQADAVIYGFQLTALDSQNRRAGTFDLLTQTPAQTQVLDGIVGSGIRSYVSHTVDGTIPTMFGSKSWSFYWRAPAAKIGTVTFYAAGNAADSNGGPGGDFIYTTTKSIRQAAVSDFDADGRSDVAVFRPSNGIWYSQNSTNGATAAFPFGINGDRVVAADYDGDGKTDYAVFRPSNGTWYIQRSLAGLISIQFGSNGDEPAIGDYDADGLADLAVFRPSNNVWYIRQSSNGAISGTFFGLTGDKIAQGDYDADGKTDIAVFRPSSGIWYLNRSTAGFTGIQFGLSTDKPAQADYDGDGKTDLAVYRSGTWYLQRSTDGFTGIQFGISTDRIVPADYDGDGKADLAVYRDGNWYVQRSTNGSFYAVNFGLSTDIPVPSGYLAQ